MPLKSLPGKLCERVRAAFRQAIALAVLKSDSVVVSFYRADWRQFSDLNLTVHAEPAARIAHLGLATDPPRASEAARRQCGLGVAAPRTPRSFRSPHGLVCKAPA
jgi:hypothetical protein